MTSNQKISRTALFLLLFLFAGPSLFAQQSRSLTGEESNYLSDGTGYITYTKKELKRSLSDTEFVAVYAAPPGVDIVSATLKKKLIGFEFRNVVVILLSDGTIVEYDVILHSYQVYPNTGLNTGTAQYKKIAGSGDLDWTLSTNSVLFKSISQYNFAIDSAGLNGALVIDITIDSSGRIYAGTFSGLFSKLLTDNSWVKNTGYPVSSCSVVYCDQQNRLFAANTSRLYKSTNGGASFTIDTAGIGTRKVVSLGSDQAGNIYAVINSTSGFQSRGDRLYRSDLGNSPFVRIDTPVSNRNADILNPYIFNNIGGRSSIMASTQFGLFRSIDLGITWATARDSASSEQQYGLVKCNNGRLLTTSNLGCFGANRIDSPWIKFYPTASYLGGQPLFNDNSGSIFTKGPILFTDLNSQTRMILKSTDNGNNWLPDTSGIFKIHMFNWFVDENGVQHAAQFNNGTAPIDLFIKQPAQNWVNDNAGFASTNSAQPIAFGSNGNGKTYFSFTNNVYTKNGLANWLQEIAGLNDNLYSFAHSSAHTVYAGGSSGVWKQQPDNSWIKLNSPLSPTGAVLSAYAIAMDNHDKLWGAFSYLDNNFKSVGTGVFFTTDDGANWKSASYQRDTFTYRLLIPIGDSVYGLSYYNGTQIFSMPLSNAVPPQVNNVSISYTGFNNTSGTPAAPYYTNYSPSPGTSAFVYRKDRFQLSAQVSAPGTYTIAGWVDYNNDNILSPSENVLLTTGSSPVITKWIQVPDSLTATSGKIRIRVSNSALTSADCCNNLGNGETEDYTIKFSPVQNCSWIGLVSSDWHDPANWSCGVVPDGTKSVKILLAAPYPCEITNADVTIDRLWVEPGASFKVNNNRKLTVAGKNVASTW